LRFTRENKRSRNRIRLLEKDESAGQRLVHIFASLEREVEATVADLVDPDTAASTAQMPNAQELDVPVTGQSWLGKQLQEKSTDMSKDSDCPPPRITPGQHVMAAHLNALPQLRKEIAFIQSRNSHGTIVARDADKFEFRREGLGIVRHWAACFVL
jgi:hypothetical protein